MIVFCAGLRSSASTLQWQIAKHIVEAKQLGFGFIVNSGNSIDKWLNSNKIIVVKQHKVSHTKYLENGKPKILMTIRDLRDVICSLMQRWNCEFEIAFDKLQIYISQQEEWAQFSNMLYLAKYENWIQDIYQEVYNTANFLNIEIDDDLAKQISLAYSFNNNKNKMNKGHITDGAIGKYLFMLSSEQIEIIEEKFNGWLIKYGYNYKQ